MQIWAESGKSALPICNYSQILYQFLTFTQNLKRSLHNTPFDIKTVTIRSRLLLTSSGCFFGYIPIPCMSLSSRNRSIFNTFRLILPCVAPVCEGMHYHKTGVPWQMDNTLIIVLFLLPLPRNALFYK